MKDEGQGLRVSVSVSVKMDVWKVAGIARGLHKRGGMQHAKHLKQTADAAPAGRV